MPEPFPFPEPGDDKIPPRWKEHPPWKSDPDLADLVEIMQPLEQDYWSEGGQSHQEREVFLARIEARWRRWKNIAWQRLGRKPERPGIDLTGMVQKILESTTDRSQRKSGAKVRKVSRTHSKLDLGPLKEEVDRATKVMGEAAKILRSKSALDVPDIPTVPETQPQTATVAPKEKVSWIHRIPVWKEFGHWLKWASACFVFACTMTQLDEYLWAELGLLLCGACCIAQIYVWTTDKPKLLAKVILGFVSIGLLGIAALTVYKKKGDKAWINLLTEKQAAPSPPTITTNPALSQPASSPSIQPTPSPVSSPTPKVTKPRTKRRVGLTEEEKWILRQLNSNKNAHAQKGGDITKEELKSVLTRKLSKRGFRLLVGQVRKRGVSFPLTPDNEKELRAFASEHGNANIDSLIVAVRESSPLPPAVQAKVRPLYERFVNYPSVLVTPIRKYPIRPSGNESMLRIEVRLVFEETPQLGQKRIVVYIPPVRRAVCWEAAQHAIAAATSWMVAIEKSQNENPEFSVAGRFSPYSRLVIFQDCLMWNVRAKGLRQQGHEVFGPESSETDGLPH